MIEAGATIGGRYQVVRVIGHGGMGEVYEAVQSPLGRRVALKTIRAELAQKPSLLARFRREAESAAALGHPNIVQVTDFYDVQGETPFIVMEMLEGETLAELLAREKRLDPQRAAFIAVQLLSGLSAAHRAGIIHRDVKPANVFLQSTMAVRDLVKVLDFGIAKLEEDAANGARPMTRAGEVLGTYAYMAPEQRISGRTVDARTDVYGVGATLFHALSGFRVLEVTTPGAGRPPFAQLAHWVHRDLAAIVDRAIADAMDARFSSAEEMAAALQPFAAATGIQAPTHSPSGAPPAPSGGGLDASAVQRMSAPTGGSMFGTTNAAPSTVSPFGATSASPPPAPSPSSPSLGQSGGRWNLYAQTPPPGPPPPLASAPAPFPPPPQGYYAAPPHTAMPTMPSMPYAAPKGGVPWWVFLLIGVLVLGMAAPYLVSFLAIRTATNPDNIANNVEREVLKQPKQPCPAPESCTVKREEHGLVYPLCTKRSPRTSEYQMGEMVLAGSDERIALVTGVASGGRYTIRFLTKPNDDNVGDSEIHGRLCRATTRD
ncbi:MAG: protein kinase [Deltaproteobacteria bacterium]|nr:protein kinase [Deltaproteobacteria bacterium]